MKQFLAVSVLLVTFTVGSVVSAQVASSTLPDPGTLPDSPLYFLKSWKEGIQLFFTFGAESKTEQYLHLAEVRLAEYEKMLEKGKDDIAERTLAKYEDQLSRALTKAEELKAKGEGMADELKTKVEEAASKHLSVLGMNLDKVSESARAGIERALEKSRKQLEKLDEIFDEEFENLLDGGNDSQSHTGKPRIVEHFACSDYCLGPREQYLINIYEGVTDATECTRLGGDMVKYVGWGEFNVCKVREETGEISDLEDLLDDAGLEDELDNLLEGLE